MTTHTNTPPAPDGLTASAAAVWRDFHEELAEDFGAAPDARESAILREAVRHIATADRLEDELASLGSLCVPGSRGNERVHPLVSELDKVRRTVATLLGQLKPPATKADNGRKGAAVRWDRAS